MEYIRMQFNRMEAAGSLGDLGTLLPMTIGMIMINGMSAVGTFYLIGLFYILAGSYFRIPIAVQPMKVVGAYAIATAMTAQQVAASTLLISIFLAIIALTGAADKIGRAIPKSVVRGVQLSTGILLMRQGIQLILGTSTFQQQSGTAEPYFSIQQFGPIPLGLAIGLAGLILTFRLLHSKRFPASLIVIGLGLVAGIFLGDHRQLLQISPGLFFPSFLPFGIPDIDAFTVALFTLTLPQIPMTIGNAVVATTDLSKDYFKESANRVTYTSTTLSMSLAAAAGFLFGTIPLCHGSGGLAAHYQFGARTHGSNIIIGSFFLLLAIFFGPQTISLLHLLPMAILGVLLAFAGVQLALAILDMMNRKDMFVVIAMLTITLTTNLAWAFLVGILLAYALRSQKFSI
jgi:SulP family sulfate permease